VQIYFNFKLPRKLAVFLQLAASANRVAANEKPVMPPAKQANLTCRRITAVKWNPEPPPPCPPLRRAGPRGATPGNPKRPRQFGSAAGGFTQAPGGRAAPKLERVEFPAFAATQGGRPVGYTPGATGEKCRAAVGFIALGQPKNSPC